MPVGLRRGPQNAGFCSIYYAILTKIVFDIVKMHDGLEKKEMVKIGKKYFEFSMATMQLKSQEMPRMQDFAPFTPDCLGALSDPQTPCRLFFRLAALVEQICLALI